MAQKVVMKVLTLTNEKTRKKAMEAAAEVLGVDSIAVDLNEQKMTVIGEMNTDDVVKKVRQEVGNVEVLSTGPAATKQNYK